MRVKANALLLIAGFTFLGGCSKPMRQITSSPTGAEVTFNGRLVGISPTMEKEPPYGQKCWDAGTYSVKLPGYKPFSKWRDGSCEDVVDNLLLEKLTEISLDITSNPPEAAIFFGKDIKKKKVNAVTELGNTPLHLSKNDAETTSKPTWDKGFYKASLKGYRNKIIEVEETDKSYKINFDLVPLPIVPEPPAVSYPTPESVVITPVMLDNNKDQLLSISESDNIALLPFNEPAGSGAGSLMTDSLILSLKNRGYKVVDRDSIERIMKEHGMLAERKTSADDLEMINKLGKIISAKYFIFGAITDYSAKSETVSISPVIVDSEKGRYQKEFSAYNAYYASEEEQPPLTLKSLQTWEMDYVSKPKSYYITIARVGITAKMVDVSSTKIMWVGIANTTDMRLQEAVKRIANTMIDDFTGTKMQVSQDPSKK